VNLFKQRQPKRFSYTPRHLKEHHKDKSYEFDPQWRQKTQRKKKTSSLLVLMIILGMVIVIWYVLSNYEI
jgi:cytoskeletal protein RodZ